MQSKGGIEITSIFQMAKISGLLWSVGWICNAGYALAFISLNATIYHVDKAAEVGACPRKEVLWAGDLRNPAHKAKPHGPAEASRHGFNIKD